MFPDLEVWEEAMGKRTGGDLAVESTNSLRLGDSHWFDSELPANGRYQASVDKGIPGGAGIYEESEWVRLLLHKKLALSDERGGSKQLVAIYRVGRHCAQG